MGEALQPDFISLTWRSGFQDETVWLRIGNKVQKQLGIEVLLHLTCHLPRSDLIRVLVNARAAGIQNIMVLRGEVNHFVEGVTSKTKWRACADGFKNAIELVHLIRAEHGSYFCIGVAGYPEVHSGCWNSKHLPPSDQSRNLDLERLNDKVTAGADFIVTQFFYDVEVFWNFRNRCEEIGIKVPIIAGYAPIQNFSSFEKFKSWCQPQIPVGIESQLNLIKDNDEAVLKYGVEIGATQCDALLKRQAAGIHFTTLNLASSVASILRKLKLRDASKDSQRELPWRGLVREREEVRPIFWAHRYSSYLSMTSSWREYPNGRWGDYRSAATFELGDYYLAEKQRSPSIESKALWGAPQNAAEVANVFVKYVQGKIDRLPWCDQKLSPESESISQSLSWINKHGFLTINSQPKVNGMPSTNKTYGWGGTGGVCFQKAYVEFFCSPESWARLHQCLGSFNGLLSYHAINSRGDEEYLDSENNANTPRPSGSKFGFDGNDSAKIKRLSLGEASKRQGRVNAVTWAVFPGREIIQPTVVDTETFRLWKAEAFELWLSQWASVYQGSSATDEEQNTMRLIQNIHDNWFLVNIVDNDYVSESSDIFEIFKKVILDYMNTDELRERVDMLENENAKLHMELVKARINATPKPQ